jgi:hypothetical protein
VSFNTVQVTACELQQLHLFCVSFTGKMTSVSRKRQSTHGTGHEPKAKIQRNISKSKKPRKSKRTNECVLKRDSKKKKAAGK